MGIVGLPTGTGWMNYQQRSRLEQEKGMIAEILLVRESQIGQSVMRLTRNVPDVPRVQCGVLCLVSWDTAGIRSFA